MTVDMYRRVIESIGYQNMIEGLNVVFPNNYKIIKVIPDDDETSYDFRVVVDSNDMYLDIGVSGSGNSHQFQTGVGTISAGVPSKKAFGRLITGEQGESLSRVTKDESIKFGASADNIKQIKQYFQKLKDYLESKSV